MMDFRFLFFHDFLMYNVFGVNFWFVKIFHDFLMIFNDFVIT